MIVQVRIMIYFNIFRKRALDISFIKKYKYMFLRNSLKISEIWDPPFEDLKEASVN